jgi:hypothetical protein
MYLALPMTLVYRFFPATFFLSFLNIMTTATKTTNPSRITVIAGKIVTKDKLPPAFIYLLMIALVSAPSLQEVPLYPQVRLRLECLMLLEL